MPVQTHDTDILPHIDADGAPQIMAGAEAAAGVEPVASLEARTAAVRGCITVISLGVASIKVCYSVSGSGIHVSAALDTPFKDITLGSATLNKSRPCVTLGGGALGFKAEIKICYKVSKHQLCFSPKICLAGSCKSGETCIKL